MKAVIEGLVFLSGEDGLTLQELSNIIEMSENDTKDLIKELYNDYKSNDRGINIEYLGDHFKLTTKKIHKEYYKKLIKDDNSNLSESALEVLAIIAYNAPITRLEIDNIRGINSSYALRKLLIKGLIKEDGRADTLGKPRLYNITPLFLDYFGLGSIKELPKVEVTEKANSDINLFDSKYTEENSK